MAGYDNTLDVVLATIGDTDEEAGNIRVTIQSYNGGTPKVGMVRIRTKKDGTESFRRLGRVTAAEALALVPLLTAVSQHPAFGEDAVVAPAPAPKPAPKPAPVEEPEAEESSTDDDELDVMDVVATMKKGDLVELATNMGIQDIPKGIAKLRTVVAEALAAAA